MRRVPTRLSDVPYAVWGWGDAPRAGADRRLSWTPSGPSSRTRSASSWPTLAGARCRAACAPHPTSRRRCRRSARRTRSTAPGTPSAAPTSDLIRGLSGDVDPRSRPRRPPGPAEDVEAVLDWAVERDVAVVPFGGGTSVVGGVGPVPGGEPSGRWSRWTSDACPACSNSTAPAAPPASRPAPSAPRPTPPSSRTGSACASSRSPTSGRASAAGSPPAPPATTPAGCSTSTTWSSRSAPARPSAGGSPAGCPVPGPDPARTGCCSAARARSA